MGLKILHTGDVHIGAKFSMLGDKADEHRKQIQKTFQKSVDIAIERHADVFLIAGDLFDTYNPSQYSISFVRNELKRLQTNGIWVVVLPGTHDKLSSGSVYATENFDDTGDRIIVFNDPKVTSHFVSDLDTTFYASPNTSNKSGKSPISSFQISEEGSYHIGLAHGSIQIEGKSSPDDYPITLDEISKSKIDYLAIGHWHSAQDYSSGNTTAWYCGSPEMVAFDQSGAGNVLLVEIEDNSKTKVEKVQVGEKKYIKIEVDLSQVNDLSDLLQMLTDQKDLNTFLEIILKGIRKGDLVIDEEKLLDELSSCFYAITIKDRSTLDWKSMDENMYPENYIIGNFLQSVKEADLDDETKNRVLSYGISLLSGRDIL